MYAHLYQIPINIISNNIITIISPLHSFTTHFPLAVGTEWRSVHRQAALPLGHVFPPISDTSATTTADLLRSLPPLQIPPFPTPPFIPPSHILFFSQLLLFTLFLFHWSVFLAWRSVGRIRSCCGLSKYGTATHQVHRTGQCTLLFSFPCCNSSDMMKLTYSLVIVDQCWHCGMFRVVGFWVAFGDELPVRSGIAGRDWQTLGLYRQTTNFFCEI